MSETTSVYGASDDLIEVEGGIREEFYLSSDDDDGDILAFSTGVVLRIRYSRDGVWRISPLAGASRVEIRLAPADDEDNYSDVAVLLETPAWVVHGTGWAKSSIPGTGEVSP